MKSYSRRPRGLYPPNRKPVATLSKFDSGQANIFFYDITCSFRRSEIVSSARKSGHNAGRPLYASLPDEAGAMKRTEPNRARSTALAKP